MARVLKSLLFFRTGTAKRGVCLVQLDLRMLLQNFAKEQASGAFFFFHSLLLSTAFSRLSKEVAVFFSKNLIIDLAKKIKSKRKTAMLMNSFVYRDIFM